MYFKKHIYRYFLFSAVPGIALSRNKGDNLEHWWFLAVLTKEKSLGIANKIEPFYGLMSF